MLTSRNLKILVLSIVALLQGCGEPSEEPYMTTKCVKSESYVTLNNYTDPSTGQFHSTPVVTTNCIKTEEVCVDGSLLSCADAKAGKTLGDVKSEGWTAESEEIK